MISVLRFHFVPIEDEDPEGADVFVSMDLPDDEEARKVRINEIEDAISSYIDGVSNWTLEQLAAEVAQSFDKDAKIISIPTFRI